MSRIARSTLIIATFFTLDKVLGFVRQVLVARQFGLSYEIDVFNAANNIPDLLSALISGGALGIAFIPVIIEYLQQRGRPAAWDLFARILNLAFLVTGAVALLVALLAGPFVRYVVAPGFPPEQQALTVSVMRLDLIAILVFSISGLVMAGLQANQHFLLPAMAPGFYNLGQIFGVAVLSPSQGLQLGPLTLPAFGLGIYGMVYGVIIGAALHLAIQVPGLLHYGFRWAPVIGLSHPGVRQVLRLMGPRVLTMFFLQLSFIGRDNLASRLGEGSVTALNYGWFIMQVPETLIGTAIAIAMLPTLAEFATRAEWDAFRDTLNHAIRILLALTIPIAALLWLGITPLVQTAFGFDPAGTEMVVWATRVFLLAMIGHVLMEVGTRAYYALQNAVLPMLAAALNAAVYLLAGALLYRPLGVVGVAAANLLAFAGEALLLLWLLNRRLPGLLDLDRALLRVAGGTLLGGLVTFLLLRLPLPALPLALAAMAAGGLCILPFIWPEIKLFLKL